MVRKLSLHERKERRGQEMMVAKVNKMTERNSKEAERKIDKDMAQTHGRNERRGQEMMVAKVNKMK